MESTSRYNRALPLQSHTSSSMKQTKSGYEPSDTETEWQESPWRDHKAKNGGDLAAAAADDDDQVPKVDSNLPRSISSAASNSSRHALKIESDNGFGSPSKFSSTARRRQGSKSPYKAKTYSGNLSSTSRNNSNSPQSKYERRRQSSPYKPAVDVQETAIRLSERPNYNRRAITAPRLRPVVSRDHESSNQGINLEQRERIATISAVSRNSIRRQREAVSKFKAPTVGELNEMVASLNILQEGPITTTTNNAPGYESSIGDIFSRDVFATKGGVQVDVNPRPVIYPQRDSSSHQGSRSNGGSIEYIDETPQRPSLPLPPMRAANFVFSKQSSMAKFSTESKISDASGKSSTTSLSSKKFANNMRKASQSADTWFSCMRKSSCRNSKSSPEKRGFDETLYIQRASVVEKLRPFWADKHQPSSLNGFICHKHEAQFLKELVSNENCPHILFKGPSGSGKRTLAVALLSEIYGDTCRNISHDLRYFPVQEKRPMRALVPIASSAHHVELNVNLQPNAKYALMGLVKEIRDSYAITPEISQANFKRDYKVIVIYEVDKAAEHIQHLIKWIMDGYTDSCKLILCCEDDVCIVESVKSRCKVIKVDSPVTHEIMEVLIQIAKKEDFELSMSFAAKIATKSKQNLRKAIMALEACKAHNYPFADDQPIPLGWEEVLIELAAEILTNPSTKRLFFIRGKIQKLLGDFVHPKLILLKLVEEFLKSVDASLKREIYYWHAYYEKRLPSGTSAVLKLEEFVAKFMSIYRKNSGDSQFE